MKIGIISDTHRKVGRAKKLINRLMEEEVEFFLHAGDIVKIEVLDYLKSLQIPFYAVLGNNDYHLVEVMDRYPLHSEPFLFELEGVTFKLMHYPNHIFPLNREVIVYGHTHEVDITFNGKNLILNPGEACARDTGYSSGMVLEITPTHYTVTLFYRKIKTDLWLTRREEFKRPSN